MKRLIAYVLDIGELRGMEWRPHVELFSNGQTRPVLVHDQRRRYTAFEAIQDCEEIALACGFGLRWHGFVAHGFEIEAQNAKAEGAGGA